jgi:hypothetical protein
LSLSAFAASTPNSKAASGTPQHLAHVIRLFAPGEDVEAIKPVHQWRDRRGRANWSRLALDVRCKANAPMTKRAIANRIARAEGVTDPKTVASIECSMRITLEKRIGEGVVRVEGSPNRWRLD